MCSWHDIPQTIRFVRIPRHMPSIKCWAWFNNDIRFFTLITRRQSEIHKIGMYSSIGRMKQEFLISFRAWESRELGTCKNAFELCDTMRKKLVAIWTGNMRFEAGFLRLLQAAGDFMASELVLSQPYSLSPSLPLSFFLSLLSLACVKIIGDLLNAK